METRVDALDDGIFQLSTSGVGRRTVNVFLFDAEEPLLFHAGTRGMFDELTAAIARVMPLERLRWLSFSHVEADEVGAMNRWLHLLPSLSVVHTPFGCATSVADLADRAPVSLAAGAALELGGRRIRLLATPHVPHNVEAVMLFEEVTATLCCSDLASNDETVRPVVDDLDPRVEPVDAGADVDSPYFPGLTSVTPETAPILRTLADIRPLTLAIMHGASFQGDSAHLLRRLADRCEEQIRQVADASRATVTHDCRGAEAASRTTRGAGEAPPPTRREP